MGSTCGCDPTWHADCVTVVGVGTVFVPKESPVTESGGGEGYKGNGVERATESERGGGVLTETEEREGES